MGLGRNTVFTLLNVLAILSLNLVIARPINYPLTIAPIFMVLFIFLFFYPPNLAKQKKILTLFLILLLFPFINVFQISFGSEELINFLRTYSLWGFSVVCVVIALMANIRKAAFSLETVAQIVLVLLTALLIMQVTFDYAFGDTTLFSMLDKFSFGGVVQLNRFAVLGAVRPIGLYFEPSICALVMVTMMTILLLRDKLFTAVGFVGAVGIVITTSFFGYVALAILLLVYIFGRMRGAKGLVNNYPLSRLLIWVFFLGGFIFFYNNLQTASISPISRAAEVSHSISPISPISSTANESSSYERLVKPISVLRDVVLNHPSGIVFGRFPAPEFQTIDYHLPNGEIVSFTLNNGFYILIFSFGWVGIAAVLLFLSWLTYRSVLRMEFNQLVLLTYIFLSFGVTGMIFRPEYVTLLLLTIYQYRISSMVSCGNVNGLRSQ